MAFTDVGLKRVDWIDLAQDKAVVKTAEAETAICSFPMYEQAN
jgi:hypothetical protein